MDDDAWDRVVNFEQEAYQRGFDDGCKDAVAEEDGLDDGRRGGLLRGYALGLELGYMKAIVEEFEATMSESNNDSTGPSTPSGTSGLSARQQRRFDDIMTRIQSFPRSNDQAFDFEQAMAELRNVFKLYQPSIEPMALQVVDETASGSGASTPMEPSSSLW